MRHFAYALAISIAVSGGVGAAVWVLLLPAVPPAPVNNAQAPPANKPAGPDERDAQALKDFARRLEQEHGRDRWTLKVGKSTVFIDEPTGSVVRRDATGKVEWSAKLDEQIKTQWWPNLRADEKRVFVSHPYKWVAALSADTGKVLWRKASSHDCFWLSGDLLLLAEGREFIALAADSGAVAFRLALPAGDDFRPVEIVETAGMFLVQSHWHGCAFVIDRTGQIRYQLNEHVADLMPTANGCVFLTENSLVKLGPDHQAIWQIALKWQGWMPYGKIVTTPDGDLVAFHYNGICNSGAEVVRVNPVNGDLRWRMYCQPLADICHSKYQHDVDVHWINGQLCVVSIGDQGSFVEWLAAGTGKKLRRSETRD
jgi:hypothetical protein